MPTYTVDRVKFFNGMEGQGWNARLLRDGRPVCEAIDDASGGPVMFHWLDAKAPAVDVTVKNYMGELHTYRGTPEEALLAAHCLAMPDSPVPGLTDGTTVSMSMDIFVDELVSRVDLEKRVKALVKRSLCCLRPDGQVVTWSLKKYPEEQLRNHVRTKHPDFKILNDMPLEEQIKHLSK